MRALLDTSVLIATDLPALDGELVISAASLAELHVGVMVTADDARLYTRSASDLVGLDELLEIVTV